MPKKLLKLAPVAFAWLTGVSFLFGEIRDPAEALAAFSEHRAQIVAQPVCRIQSYIFFTYRKTVDPEEFRDSVAQLSLRGEAMLDLNDQIARMALNQLTAQTGSGSRRLLELIETDELPHYLGIRFDQVPMQIAQSGIYDGEYIHVTVVRQSLLNGILKSAAAADLDTLVSSLARRFQSLIDPMEKEVFCLKFGAIDLAIIHANMAFAKETNLDAFADRTIRMGIPFYKQINLLESGDLSRKTEQELLKSLSEFPNHPALLRELAQRTKRKFFYSGMINFHMLAGLEDRAAKQDLWETVKGLSHPAYLEYGNILGGASAKVPTDLNPDGVLAMVIKAAGFLNLPRTDHHRIPDAYSKALKQFMAGQVPEQIIKQLEIALETNPRHVPSWSLLGACFRVIGDYPNAIACLRMALRLDATYADALTNLAICYSQINAHQNSFGLALFGMFHSSPGEWSYKTCRKMLED